MQPDFETLKHVPLFSSFDKTMRQLGFDAFCSLTTSRRALYASITTGLNLQNRRRTAFCDCDSAARSSSSRIFFMCTTNLQPDEHSGHSRPRKLIGANRWWKRSRWDCWALQLGLRPSSRFQSRRLCSYKVATPPTSLVFNSLVRLASPRIGWKCGIKLRILDKTSEL